jgi:phosphatidate cytidylyltransferase
MAPLLIVLIFAPTWIVLLLIIAAAVISVWELTGHCQAPIFIPARILCMGFSTIFLLGVWFDRSILELIALFFVFFFLLAVELILHPITFDFSRVLDCFFAGVASAVLWSSMVVLLLSDQRTIVVLLPFIVTIPSDMGAFILGTAFGKHKLIPEISPKKSVEGSIGGFLVSMAVMQLYGLVLQFVFHCGVNYLVLLLYSLCCGIVSQVGDLFFSAIKRSRDIKDFSRLIPGHGGLLDRFDSLLFVAPLIAYLITIIPGVALP